MSATLLKLRPETPRWEPRLPFELVVAYEDEITRSRAIALYENLAGHLNNDHEVRYSWWKFHFLYDPALLKRAITAAIDADLIIVALRDAGEPPWIARNWIEKWLAGKGRRDGALVALVEGAPSIRFEDCAMLGYLNSVADRARMNFFPHVFPATPLNVINPPGGVSAHGTIGTPLVEDLLRSPTNGPLWGINEY